MIITRNIKKLVTWPTRAFTLLESLLVLAISVFLLLGLTGGIEQTFTHVQERLFFLSFEHLYQDSQKLSNAQQKSMTLKVANHRVENSLSSLEIPASIQPERDYQLTFWPDGGNSSLEKLRFQTSDKTVTYQLYIGSGRYKKTEN